MQLLLESKGRRAGTLREQAARARLRPARWHRRTGTIVAAAAQSSPVDVTRLTADIAAARFVPRDATLALTPASATVINDHGEFVKFSDSGAGALRKADRLTAVGYAVEPSEGTDRGPHDAAQGDGAAWARDVCGDRSGTLARSGGSRRSALHARRRRHRVSPPLERSGIRGRQERRVRSGSICPVHFCRWKAL